MLKVVGAESLDDLIAQTIPNSIRQTNPLACVTPHSETEALAKMRAIAEKNQVFTSLIGQGYSGTILPTVILRNILENPAWYTAYTPYQAEISQGRMEALINFQQMCADLTGMEIANASLLDEATAAAEAMTLAKRSAKSKSNTFLVFGDCHPQTIEVLRTRAEPLGIALEMANSADEWQAAMDKGDFFGALIQYPASSGWLFDWTQACATIHAHGALAVFATDLLALTLLKPPGEMGADIVIAVDVNSQHTPIPQPTHLLTVMSQALAIMGRSSVGYLYQDADLVIRPEITHIRPDDLTKAAEMIAAGEVAARRIIPRLKQLLAPQKQTWFKRLFNKATHDPRRFTPLDQRLRNKISS